jgi:hypothetical protein
MLDTIQQELDILETSSLSHLIPSHLFSYFKIELNDRILPSLILDLDNLLKTIDANNIFKQLSINDDQLNNTGTNLNDSSASCNSSNVSEGNLTSSKSSIIEISSRLIEILSKFSNEIFAYVDIFEKQQLKYTKIQFMNEQELLVYQRAILVQKLTNKHYDLFNLLFRNVFDFYHKFNKHNESSDNTENSFLTKQVLIEKFLKINQIL